MRRPRRWRRGARWRMTSARPAALDVVVDQPARLHQRVGGRRADEAEAAPLELLGQRGRLRRDRRDLAPSTAAPAARRRPARTTRSAPPRSSTSAAARAFAIAASILARLRTIPASAISRATSSSPNRATAAISKPANAARNASRLRRIVSHDEPGLERLEAEPLVQRVGAADRPAPLLVVVGDVVRRARAPAAAGQAVLADDQVVAHARPQRVDQPRQLLGPADRHQAERRDAGGGERAEPLAHLLAAGRTRRSRAAAPRARARPRPCGRRRATRRPSGRARRPSRARGRTPRRPARSRSRRTGSAPAPSPSSAGCGMQKKRQTTSWPSRRRDRRDHALGGREREEVDERAVGDRPAEREHPVAQRGDVDRDGLRRAASRA